MNWTILQNMQQLSGIKSQIGFSIIFKHSTRCPVSMMAKRRVEMDHELIPEEVQIYFLDLIAYRDVSNSIAEGFNVPHESPQLLLIKDGECIYETSHGEISIEDTLSQIS
jgi:bacillithiol system protein YtxJ